MRTMEIKSLDMQKTEAFASRLLEVINHGTLALMVSIGHRTGLFDVMHEMEPATYREIAKRSKLNERYVKEWLGAMVTGKIVEYNAGKETYHFPPEHARSLTRKSGPDNMGVFAQYVSVLGGVEDEVIDCFYKGGGVPYEKYHRFHEVMAEDSGQSVLSSLESSILPLIPGIDDQLEQGIQVMDIGCGSGKALNLLARKYPKSRFVGIDLCEDPVLTARAQANEAGLKNIDFIVADLTTYKPDFKSDLITAFDAIHDQARPDIVLSTIFGSLKEEGVFLMQDIDASSQLENNRDHPLGTLLYSISTLHCMTVSLASEGMGLGTMWGVELAEKMLRDTGFTKIEIRRLSHDIQNCYFIIRK